MVLLVDSQDTQHKTGGCTFPASYKRARGSGSPGDDAHVGRARRIRPQIGKGSASPKGNVSGGVHHILKDRTDLQEGRQRCSTERRPTVAI